MIKMFEYIGKEVLFDFGNTGKIMVSYLSDTQLKWTAIHQRLDGGPQSETENFYYKKIQSDIYLISWVEDSGIVVSQVANFKEKTVNSCLTWPADDARGKRGIKLSSGVIVIH